MAQTLDPIESRYARWVTSLVLASVLLGLLTILLSLSDGTVGKALPFGVASFAFAVASRITAQGIKAHRAAATAAVIFGVVALGSGLQSALIGTGQI
jgi:hypothetical protein